MGNIESPECKSMEYMALKLAINYHITIKMNSNYHRQVDSCGEQHCLLQSSVVLACSFVWTVCCLHGPSSLLHPLPQSSHIHNLLADAERETDKTAGHSAYQVTTVVPISNLALSQLYHRLLKIWLHFSI